MEIINGERLVLGTCYYPEHWDESLWRDDLRRMLENGIEVIRIAEFALSKIERYEGVFNYDFFDRYNNDKRIKRKYELREEIIYSSQSLVEDMKSIIDKIVRIYEIEEV